MKNPLRKRIFRELKQDIGKYLVIFLFMILLISLVSGFLVADNSMQYAYNEGFTKYNLEWGHFTLTGEPETDFLDMLEEKGDVKLFSLQYFNEETAEGGKTIRVYKDREYVNLECIMSGRMPSTDTEIALDRMFAENNDIKVGDTITLNNKTLTVSGYIAVPDYSCLFENNTDMMFDSINFSIAVMTEGGYNSVGSTKQFYNYAWMYNNEPADESEEIEYSDDFLEVLKEQLTDYDTKIMTNGGDMSKIISVDDYVTRYTNQAINFTGEDMGGDKAMFTLFDYIVIIILAFVFAVTTSNTITQEAGVIGTLRASGYTRGELVRHYMILPVIITLIAAVIGNILGYTVIKDIMANLYYGSYSLSTYEVLWNAQAFIDTTLIPIILMLVINFVVLTSKLRLSPLKFLRRELSKNSRKKAFRLNTKIPFLQRFRIRILFQNIPNYITLFIGIIFAAVIIIFGFMFGPLLEDYSTLVSDSMIAEYQYILMNPVETENNQAEKYCLTSLDTTYENYMTDEITIYGISDNSSYITEYIPNGKVIVSYSILEKFGLEEGDSITLKETYDDKTYEFTIAGAYQYDAALAIFMTRDDFLEAFDKDENYFTGYFSNDELSDIDYENISAVIDKEDLTKVSRQLLVSTGEFMNLFKYFGAIMFLLLMYLLSKQIIEKNSQSISMSKILGFTNGEIAGLYIIATSIVVIISLLLAIPVTSGLLHLAFSKYLYTMITGYIPFSISNKCYISMFVIGIVCYAAVAALQLLKIRKISKSDALKNVE